MKAIAQNEHRVEALGFKTFHYKVIASIVVASFSGALYIITLRFMNTSVFSIEVTLNALLMTMLGLGLLYIIVLLLFPTGLVGTIQKLVRKTRKNKDIQKEKSECAIHVKD